MKFPAALAATAALTFALSGCGDAPFAERDPEGYEACSMYAEASANTGVERKLGGLLQVGKQARRASTKAIRDSAEPLFDEEVMQSSGLDDDFPLVDSDALEAACEEQGFEF